MASQLLKKGIQKEEEAFLKRLRLYVDKKHQGSVDTVTFQKNRTGCEFSGALEFG